MESQKNTLFPVFLKLDRLEVLIVGGGDAASEKVRFMLKSSPDARVTVVAIEASDEIKQLNDAHPQVELILRPFGKSDLHGKDLAIIATEDRELNSHIHGLSKAGGILTNVADTPALCDFYLGSIVTKGNLKVAVSTNGKSPTFAKRFRQMMEEALPEEVDDLLINLRAFRDTLQTDFSEKVKTLNAHTSELVSAREVETQES